MARFSANADHPTEQTFHVTGLDPRSALCGRNGHIWAAPKWPSNDDMRSGRFVPCKDCNRLATPAVRAALDNARDLEHAALKAYRTGWSEGCLQLADPEEPGASAPEDLVQECHELGRRVGAEAARLVREARSAGQQPPPATLDDTAASPAP